MNQLLLEGLTDAIGFVGGALLGFWIGRLLGFDLLAAEKCKTALLAAGDCNATLFALALCGIGGGVGMQLARRLRHKARKEA